MNYVGTFVLYEQLSQSYHSLGRQICSEQSSITFTLEAYAAILTYVLGFIPYRLSTT